MLVQLTASRFRNLEPLDWRPAGGAHLLLGENGAGKTSLLEAVYSVATTRSFRTARIADCRRHGAAGFMLSAEVEGEVRSRLEVGLEDGERLRRVNGASTTLAEHLAALPVVAWTSADGELLSGPPEGRRKFLDRGILGMKPAELESISRYRRALAQKRQVLLSGRGGPEPWNGVLAAPASKLCRARRHYVEKLTAAFEEVLGLVGLDFPPVVLRYRPSPSEGWDSEEGVAEAFERASREELRRRMPLVGPHRDDLEISWSEREIRRVASAGERKAVALALVAAHGRVLRASGREPVYLLDDADTELSQATLDAVWRGFEGVSQLLASSNRPEVWKRQELEGCWRLRRGTVSEAEL